MSGVYAREYNRMHSRSQARACPILPRILMALDIAFARRAIPPPPPPPLLPPPLSARLCIINAVTRQKGFAIERDAPSFNQRRFLRILRALPPPPRISARYPPPRERNYVRRKGKEGLNFEIISKKGSKGEREVAIFPLESESPRS